MKRYSEFLKDARWQKKRLEIFERDGWKCCECGNSIDLQVHHIKYTTPKSSPWNELNENLQTSCGVCHKKISPTKNKIPSISSSRTISPIKLDSFNLKYESVPRMSRIVVDIKLTSFNK